MGGNDSSGGVGGLGERVLGAGGGGGGLAWGALTTVVFPGFIGGHYNPIKAVLPAKKRGVGGARGEWVEGV